jgi:hypothetical protein
MLPHGIVTNDCGSFQHLIPVTFIVGILDPLAAKPDEFRFCLVGIEQYCTVVIRCRSICGSKGGKCGAK